MKKTTKPLLGLLALVSSTMILSGCFGDSSVNSSNSESSSIPSEKSESSEETKTSSSSDEKSSDSSSPEEKTGTVAISFDPTKGNVSASKMSGKVGETITLTVTANEGYQTKEVKANGNVLAGPTYSFALVEGENTVDVTFEEITPSPEVKTGTVALSFDSEKGNVVADKTTGNVGETITLTVTPNEGYSIKEVKANGNVLAGPTYSFALVEGENAVEVSFEIALPEGATNIEYSAEGDLAADTWAYWYANWEPACSVNAAYKMADGTIHFDFANTMTEKTSWHHQMFYKDSSLEAGKYTLTAKITSTVAGTITINGVNKELVAGENNIELTYTHASKGGTSFSLQCSLLGSAVLDIANLTYTPIADELPEGATAMVFGEENTLAADTWTYWNATYEAGHIVNKAYVTKDNVVHFDFNDSNPYNPWLEQIFYKDSTLVVGTKYTFTCVINSTAAGEIIVNNKTFTLAVGDNDIEVDFTQSAAASLLIQLAKLGTAVVEIKDVKFEAYVAKGMISEGELPEGVALSYMIGDEVVNLNAKYAVGTEVTVTMIDTNGVVEDILVNNLSIKNGDTYKFAIVEGTNRVTVKLKGQTVETKPLPIIEKGNQSTKIEGAGIWIYLDNTELGITGANASEFNVAVEVSCKTGSGDNFDVTVTNKQFDDYGTNTVRLYIVLDKGPGADFKTSLKITMTHGEDVYEKETSFTGSKWDDATPVTEPTSYTAVAALTNGPADNNTRFEGAGAWIWASTDALGMTNENFGNYSVIGTEITMKNDAGADTGATVSGAILSDYNFTDKYFRIYVTCSMAPVTGWNTSIAVKILDGNGNGYKVTASFSGTEYVAVI